MNLLQRMTTRSRNWQAYPPLLLVLVFWACTFGVLSVRGIFYEPGPLRQTIPPRAAVSATGAILCLTLAGALSFFRSRNFSVLVGSALAATVLMSIIQAALHLSIYDYWYPAPVGPTAGAGLVLWSIFWLGYFLAWAGTYLALLYHREALAHQLRLATMRDLAQDAKITALRYQINPHFLFNTINSISAFVLESRPQEAERVLMKLSEFLRGTLNVEPAAMVTLAEELATQQRYLDIEAVRFSDRMRVRINLPDELAGMLVPPLILQPLVENAVNHGVSRSETPALIEIQVRRNENFLLISVTDDAAGQTPYQGSGIGLRNVRERLEVHYGAAATLSAGPRRGRGFRAELRLPVWDVRQAAFSRASSRSCS